MTRFQIKYIIILYLNPKKTQNIINKSMQEKLKYPSVFEKLLEFNNLTLSLSIYLNIQHCQINDTSLISLIRQIKTLQKKKK